MPYQIASGHNNAAGLTNLSIQPKCEGIEYFLESDGEGVEVLRGKPSTVWYYAVLDASQFETIMGELGLSYSVTPSKKVTIRTTINDGATAQDRDFANFNAVITAPPRPRFDFWQRNIEFKITAMEAL